MCHKVICHISRYALQPVFLLFCMLSILFFFFKLKMGRDCISHYASLHRYCVFSHDELTCKMAAEAEKLGPRVAVATYRDMLAMVKSERDLRKSLLYMVSSENHVSVRPLCFLRQVYSYLFLLPDEGSGIVSAILLILKNILINRIIEIEFEKSN